MKYTLTIFTIILNLAVFSQKHEFNFNTKIGTSTKNFNPYKINEYYFGLTNLNDKGVLINYKYKILNKYDLFLSTGIEFSQSKYYFKVIELDSQYHLDNVFINKNRLTLHVLGLSKEFVLYDGNIILDLGVDWIERFYFNKTDIYSIDNYIRSEARPWIEYKYNLEVNYKGRYKNAEHVSSYDFHHNLEFYLHLKTKITDMLFLNFGFNFAKKMVFYFNYRTDFLYYYTGETVPHKGLHGLGFVDINDEYRFGVKNNFLYFNVGLSYKFDKFKLKK